MKKVIFALLMSLLFLGTYAQTDERTIEVIPTISAVGGQDGISLNSELVIAKRFTLTKNHKWFLFGQLGTMYNLFQNEIGEGKFSEWQLGLEPMVGFGTNSFRVSGFLNGLAVKAWDTGRMPFVEGGVRFSIVPWRTVWLSVFSTWPLSDPVFISPLGDTYFETGEGVFLVNIERWAKQVRSYGADMDIGIGKKLVLNLDGFAIDKDNYQIGGGMQYRLFKNKPWVIGADVSYTNFKDHDYYYVQNIFPGMFNGELQGYTFKLGVSNYGGLGGVNFTQMLGRIAEPMYFSPVKKDLVKKTTRIGEAFKFEPCAWGGDCYEFEGALCITGGVPVYKLFINWGEGKGTEAYNVNEMGPFKIRHTYAKEGSYKISISGFDGLNKTYTYSGEFKAVNCGPVIDVCENVTAKFVANSTSIKLHDQAYLNWNVTGADVVLLDGKEVNFVVKNFPVKTDALGVYTYKLEIFNKGKLCKELTVKITVVDCDLPVIENFIATPISVNCFGSSEISWNVTGAEIVKLDGNIVPSSGSKTYSITKEESFTLEAINKCGSVEKPLSVGYTPCIVCADTNSNISGKTTDMTRYVTLTNSGHITNLFLVKAIGKADSAIKVQKEKTYSLNPGESKTVTIKYDKNVTITFDGVVPTAVGTPMCTYYLVITAECVK